MAEIMVINLSAKAVLHVLYYVVLQLIGRSLQADVCQAPFSNYLKCLADEASNRITLFEEDASEPIQNKIKLCYSKYNCAQPDFSKATVENFLDEPWLSRVNTILDLLESTDPRIQQCMIQYFNGIARRKIEGCVRQYGDDEVKNFEMPALPDWRNLDIAKIKAAVLNRMVVTQSMLECSKILTDDNQLQDSVNCVKDARLSNKGSFCAPRDQCLTSKINDQLCSARYGKVKTAACACFSAEIQQFKGTQGQMKNFNDLKDTLLQGLEKEYKKCYDRNNLPYPAAKVEAAKTAAKQAVADILFRGLPPKVRLLLRILGESVREVTGSGRRLFCENCQDNQTQSSGTAEAQQLRQLAASSSQTAARPFFAQQQAPVFPQFLNTGGR